MESAPSQTLPPFFASRPLALGKPSELLRTPWAYHMAFWTLLYLFNTVYIGYLTKDYTYAFYDYSVKLPFFLVACYANLYYLLPRLLARGRYLAYAAGLFGGLFALTVLLQIIFTQLVYADLCPDDVCTAEYTSQLLFNPKNTLHQLFPAFMLVGLTTGLKLGKSWVWQQQIVQEMERLNLQNELAFLKSQVQPHFFFNTLNNLYSLTLKKSDLAPEIVLKLADLMSYVLYEADAAQVPLAKELESLRNYVALESLRYGPRLQLQFTVSGEPAGLYVAPLLLLPFVENSFKHSALVPPQSVAITIALAVRANVLTLQVENPKGLAQPGPGGAAPRHSGVGLKNVRRRLALLYPDAHQLTITDGAQRYKIELQLPLV